MGSAARPGWRRQGHRDPGLLLAPLAALPDPAKQAEARGAASGLRRSAGSRYAPAARARLLTSSRARHRRPRCARCGWCPAGGRSPCAGGRCAEAELVVVAAGRLQPAARLRVECRHEGRRRGQGVHLTSAPTPLARHRWPRSASKPSDTSMQALAMPHSAFPSDPRCRRSRRARSIGSMALPVRHCASAAAASPSVPLTHTSSPTPAPARRSARPAR